MGNLQDLRALRAFIFDMDGVIYRGHEVVPGAAEFIANLRQAGIPFIYLTNNSSTPPDKVALRLADMGIPATASEVLTSADVTAAEVSRAVTGRQALVVGEEGIRSALTRSGFTLVDDHRDADVVVVGIDRQTTYARLREAALAIRRGAPFFATNTDRTLPTEAGLVPGAGRRRRLPGDCDRRPADRVRQAVAGHFPLRPGAPSARIAEATAAIGDRPDTDILGGQRGGSAHHRGAVRRRHSRRFRRHAAAARLDLPQPGGVEPSVFWVMKAGDWRAETRERRREAAMVGPASSLQSPISSLYPPPSNRPIPASSFSRIAPDIRITCPCSSTEMCLVIPVTSSSPSLARRTS